MERVTTPSFTRSVTRILIGPIFLQGKVVLLAGFLRLSRAVLRPNVLLLRKSSLAGSFFLLWPPHGPLYIFSMSITSVAPLLSVLISGPFYRRSLPLPLSNPTRFHWWSWAISIFLKRGFCACPNLGPLRATETASVPTPRSGWTCSRLYWKFARIPPPGPLAIVLPSLTVAGFRSLLLSPNYHG